MYLFTIKHTHTRAFTHSFNITGHLVLELPNKIYDAVKSEFQRNNNFLGYIGPMQYLGHMHTKKSFAVYLK